MKVYETIPEITRRLQELEEEQKQLIRTLLHLRQSCSHTNEQGDILRIRSHFDGIKDVWVCSRCGKEMKQNQ